MLQWKVDVSRDAVWEGGALILGAWAGGQMVGCAGSDGVWWIGLATTGVLAAVDVGRVLGGFGGYYAECRVTEGRLICPSVVVTGRSLDREKARVRLVYAFRDFRGLVLPECPAAVYPLLCRGLVRGLACPNPRPPGSEFCAECQS